MLERLRNKKITTGLVVLAGAVGVSGCGSNVSSKEENQTDASMRTGIMESAQNIAGQAIALLSSKHLTADTYKNIRSTSVSTEIHLSYAGPALDKGHTFPLKPDYSDHQINYVTVDFSKPKGSKLNVKDVKDVIVYNYDFAVQDTEAGIGPAISTEVLYAPIEKYKGSQRWEASDTYNGEKIDTVNHPDYGLNIAAIGKEIIGLTVCNYGVAVIDFTAGLVNNNTS